MKAQDIVFTAVSIVIIVFGVIALILAGNGDLPNLWFSALLTLLGVIVVANNKVVGASMAGVGVYMMLRDVGIIQIAWLGYGLGVFFIAAGVYGMFMHRQLKQEDTQKPRTPAE